jgi:hypothetical protein
MGDAFFEPDNTPPPFPYGLLGVVFRWEGWALALEDKGDVEEFLASGRDPMDDDRRVRVITVLGFSTHGLYASAWMKGGVPMKIDDPETQIRGDIVDGLRHLFEGMQAHGIRSMNKENQQ